jgi:S1-C subfamily serine protease
MSEQTESSIPPELRPQAADCDYDLDRALTAVVSLRAQIPDDAFTASILGTERAGHGVVIGEPGLVLTIGYLVTEADQVWLISAAGRAIPGDVIGYDYESGFGLVRALGALDVPPLEQGSVRDLHVNDPVVLAGHGGRSQALKARVAARREFAGYWEYVLDEAVFTAPPHPNWGGAALIGRDGRLCGIGSLYIDQVLPQMPALDGNMCVPIDLLRPILGELLAYGRTLKPARPWLGMFVSEVQNHLLVAGVYNDAPAAAADLRAGDIVLEVAGEPVRGLATLFRTVWACGDAGSDIPLTVHRDGKTFTVRVRSVDRRDLWRGPALH